MNNFIDKDLIELIVQGRIDRKLFTEVLQSNHIREISEIKEYLQDVFIDYVKEIVEDHHISNEEVSKSTKLKLLFEIKEGELYAHKFSEIQEILYKQFSYFMIDGEISPLEELQKVNLQDLFDLGYDQFLKVYHDFKTTGGTDKIFQ